MHGPHRAAVGSFRWRMLMNAKEIHVDSHLPPYLPPRPSAIRLILLGAVVAVGLVYPVVAPANPLKTDAGTTIRNLQYFPDGVVVQNIQILPPGWVAEDGSGPPGKTIGFDPVGKEWTNAEKKKINDDIKADFKNVTVVGDPSKAYDCHGFTFKSKKMRIFNEDVDKILKDQKWDLALNGKHKKGDVIIYRDDAGKVTHSGLVEEFGADGNVTKVRSKGGASGEYVHDVKDVPASYGTKTEVRTGGKLLADPPIAAEDANVFHGLQPPPLKAALFDPFVAPVVEGYISSNALPNPPLRELTHGPVNWNYGLEIPQLGLTISPGDTLTLFGDRWINAVVSGMASSTSFGAWQVDGIFSDSIVFDATSSAFLPGNFAGLIEGFTGISVPSSVGEIVYTEAIAGSIGLVSGPSSVSEPSTVAMAVLGLLTVGWLSWRQQSPILSRTRR